MGGIGFALRDSADERGRRLIRVAMLGDVRGLDGVGDVRREEQVMAARGSGG